MLITSLLDNSFIVKVADSHGLMPEWRFCYNETFEGRNIILCVLCMIFVNCFYIQEEKRAKVEKKLEENAKREKEELKKERQELFQERKRKQAEIKKIELKMLRVKEVSGLMPVQ